MHRLQETANAHFKKIVGLQIARFNRFIAYERIFKWIQIQKFTVETTMKMKYRRVHSKSLTKENCTRGHNAFRWHCPYTEQFTVNEMLFVSVLHKFLHTIPRPVHSSRRLCRNSQVCIKYVKYTYFAVWHRLHSRITIHIHIHTTHA